MVHCFIVNYDTFFSFQMYFSFALTIKSPMHYEQFNQMTHFNNKAIKKFT